MSGMKRSTEIDALRGIAIAFVMLAHFPGLVPNDWFIYSIFRFEAGVPLFFAISGAVISGTLIPRLHPGGYGRAFLGFYIRRAYRILPLAWLWLALGLLATRYFNELGAFGNFMTNVYGAGAAVLNLANVAQAKVLILGMGMFGVYWSLSLEEQFYLVFPIFLLLTPVRYRVHVLVLFLLGLAALWRKSSGAFTLTDAFAIDSMLFGILAYLLGPKLVTRIPAGRILFFVLLLLLLGGPRLIQQSGVAYTVVGLLAGLLVLVAMADKGFVPDPGGALSWIGRRSYGLYLAHGPCIAMAHELQLRGLTAVVVWLVATFGITELLYRFVEQPLIAAGRRRAAAAESKGPQPAANIERVALT